MIDGSELRQARKRKALSQRDLSKISGVAQATIAQLERGERKARPTTLRKLSRALEVEPAVLLADPEETSQEGHTSYTSVANAKRRQAPPATRGKSWTKARVISRSSKGVEIRDEGRIHRFGSLEEAYVAGWDVEPLLFENLFSSVLTGAPDSYSLVLSKLNSDDPEKVEDGANLALYIANNIARTLEEDSGTQAKVLDRIYKAIPTSYYRNTTSVMRIVKLWKDVTAIQLEAHQTGTHAIQELIDLHAEAVHKLSTMKTSATRRRNS